MAKAVEAAIEADEHLLVQAGTGTGKSLAYLIPAVAARRGHRQAGRRGHGHAGAAGPDRRPRHAPAGRGGRAAARPPADLRAGQGPAQLPVPAQARRRLPRRRGGRCSPSARATGDAGGSRLGAEVVRLREWADETQTGDRDELVPGVSERAWRQVSVSAHECLGSKCPMVSECFVERARDARQGRRRRRDQPRASWRSTPSRAARCCPSTTCSSSTRRTSWSTGSPRRSPTS